MRYILVSVLDYHLNHVINGNDVSDTNLRELQERSKGDELGEYVNRDF
jgi:hypothetical protein